MILVVGSLADPTTLHTARELAGCGASLDVIDVCVLADRGCVVSRPGGPALTIDGEVLPLRDYSGAWMRVPSLTPGAPNTDLAAHASRLASEIVDALRELGAPVLNPASADPTNFSKVLHGARLSGETGLPSPRSVLTNDPREAVEFVASCSGGAIYKAPSNTKSWVRAWDPVADPARLHLLAGQPVLFQERIHGPDVRVHTVGADAHAELIACDAVDYRIDGTATHSAITVPPRVAACLRRMQTGTGCPMLGVDFKLASDGTWHLLEANTQPCYEGYDLRASGAISRSIHGFLSAAPSRLR